MIGNNQSRHSRKQTKNKENLEEPKNEPHLIRGMVDNSIVINSI